MYKRISGIALGIASIISLVLLSFGYRDVSMELLGMFFLTLIGLPLATYLLIKKSTYLIGAYNPYTPTDSEEEDDIIHRFCIYSETNKSGLQ